jgi:pimeloyl-ACP methyl ester carboxylesterase
MADKMQPKYLELSAGKIHYISAGNPANDTIIFLHGFPEFWYSWRKQIAYFSKDFHVIAPDLRGYNKSFKPQKIKDYKVDAIANDVIEIMDHLGKEKVIIVGHDWGAVIAWHLLLLYENRFSKGVILNVPHPLVFKNKLSSDIKQFSKSWYVFFFQIPFLPAWILSLNNFERIAKSLEETSLRDSFTKSDLEKYKLAWANENAMKHMIMWYKAAFRNPSQAKVYQDKKVNIPLKIIWGKNDLALVPEMAKESLAYCEQGDLTYLEDATHWVQQDCPEEVNRLVEDFITK